MEEGIMRPRARALVAASVVVACLAMFALHVLVEVISSARLWLLSQVGTIVTGDLRHMVYSHLHDLSRTAWERHICRIPGQSPGPHSSVE